MIQDWMVHVGGMLLVALIAFVTIKVDMGYVKERIGEIADEVKEVVLAQGVQRVDHEVLKTEFRSAKDLLTEVKRNQDRQLQWKNKETS